MSADPVTAKPAAALVAVGFFGKLPSRGDFIRSGLPGSFVTAWDGWLSASLAASRESMGPSWVEAWLEAPVWRFVLPRGQCGPDAALGLWMPSVDAAGRYFALTIAAVFAASPPVRDEGWLGAAEANGRRALETDEPPSVLAAALERLGPPGGGEAEAGATWWTEGAPRVKPQSRSDFAALPAPGCFAEMLGGGRA